MSATPTINLNLTSSSAFPGGSVPFTLTFSNTADPAGANPTGFGPFLALDLGPSSNGLTLPSGALTTSIGVSVTPVKLTSADYSAAQNGYVVPGTNAVIPAALGDTVYYIPLPLGSYAAGQTPITVTGNVAVSSTAVVGASDSIKVAGGFQYGDIQTGNTPIVAETGAVMLSTSLINVVETQSGSPTLGAPNNLTWSVWADVALNATVDNLVLTDPLPPTAVPTSFMLSDGQGNEWTYTVSGGVITTITPAVGNKAGAVEPAVTTQAAAAAATTPNVYYDAVSNQIVAAFGNYTGQSTSAGATNSLTAPSIQANFTLPAPVLGAASGNAQGTGDLTVADELPFGATAQTFTVSGPNGTYNYSYSSASGVQLVSESAGAAAAPTIETAGPGATGTDWVYYDVADGKIISDFGTGLPAGSVGSISAAWQGGQPQSPGYETENGSSLSAGSDFTEVDQLAGGQTVNTVTVTDASGQSNTYTVTYTNGVGHLSLSGNNNLGIGIGDGTGSTASTIWYDSTNNRVEVDWGNATAADVSSSKSWTINASYSGSTEIDQNAGTSTSVSGVTGGSAGYSLAQGTVGGGTIIVPQMPVQAASNAVTAELLSLSKGMTVSGGNQPGGELNWTITGNISNYADVQNIVVTDTMSSGQNFDASVGATPTLTVTEGGTTQSFALHNSVGDTEYTVGAQNAATGQTVTTYNVSTILADNGLTADINGGSAPNDTSIAQNNASFTIGYSSTIDTTYFGSNYDISGAQLLVNQGDALGNSAALSGVLVGSNTAVSASASAGDKLPVGAVSKQVYEIVRNNVDVYSVAGSAAGAVNNDALDANGKPVVQAGDVVTYELKYTLPQTNTSNLTLTDYLPQPIYDVTNANGSGGSLAYVAAPANPLAAGVVTFGPNETVPAGAESQAPVVTVNQATDSFTVNLGAYSDGSAYPSSTVDLLATVKVLNQPFVNGLDLTNEVTGVETSSVGANGTLPGTTTTTNAIAQVQLVQPVVNVTKGVTNVSNVGTSGATEQLSGSLVSDFTASGALKSGDVIDDANVAALYAGATGVQGGDTVNYVVAVQNSGGSTAFNTVIKDTLPTNVAAGSVTGVTATDGAGNAVSLIDPTTHAVLTAAQAATDLFNGTGVAIASIASDLGNTTTGANIVLLNYTGTVSNTVPVPDQTVTNQAQVTYFEGVQGSGVNFATGVAPGTLSSSVNVTTAAPSITKTVTSTSETAALPASPTLAQINALATDAANLKAGEQVTYTVTTTLSEGTYNNVTLSDVLPSNGSGDLKFVSAQVTSVGSGIENATAILNSTLSASGQTITDNLGAVTVDSNSLSGNDTITYTVTALAQTPSANLDNKTSDTLTNTASVSAQATVGSTPVVASATAAVTELTPNVTISKSVADVTTSGAYNAGDELKYTITIKDAAGAGSAYNVNVADAIATQFGNAITVDTSKAITLSGPDSATTAFGSTLGNIGGVIGQIDAGQTDTITFYATLNSADPFNTQYINTASFTADTLPATDSGYATNDQTFTKSATASLTTSGPSTTKALTGGSDANIAVGKLAPGEIGTFTATVTIPQGTANTFSIQDLLPSGMTFVSGSVANLTLVGNVTGNSGQSLTSTGVGGITETDSAGGFTLNLGALTSVGASNTLTFTYQATLNNSASLTNNQTLTNTIKTIVDGTTVTHTAPVTVVLPNLDISKTTSAGVGNIEHYTIAVSPDAVDNAPAYDVTVSDPIPTNEGIVVSSLASATPGVTETITGGTTTNGINVGGTLNITMPTMLKGGSAVDVTYDAVPVGTVAVGTLITNTATLDYATQATGGLTEAPKTSAASYNTPGASLSGVIFTDYNDDGVANSQGAGETDAGLANVTVKLFENGLNTGKTALTDSHGAYSFTGLDQSQYSVQVVAPAGYYFDTVEGSNANPALNSITNPTGATVNVATVAGENTPNQNSGLFQLGSVSGEVFFDKNDNGTEDGTDAALGNITVNLIDSNGHIVQTLTTNATTNSVNYTFNNVVPGQYSVHVITPTNEYISIPGTSNAPGAVNSIADVAGDITSINVYSGQNAGGNNAGIVLPAEITGMAFFDGQCDSLYHVGDAGVAGVTASLVDIKTGLTVQTQVTDEHGQYTFKNINPDDTYKVEFAPVAGMDFSDGQHASSQSVAGNNVDSIGYTATIAVSAGGTYYENAGLEFNGNFNGVTPTVLSAGQMYASLTGGNVIVGPGGNNVHTGSPGNNVVVLDGNGNTIELGFSSSSTQDIGTSCGSLQAQTQQAQNGFLFGGGTGSSYLVGGTGAAYLMGGTGANYLYAGSGDTTMIAGGNGSIITAGGASSTIYYQAGDGQLTIDNGLRSVDHLTIYGYSSGTITVVNGVQELVLSSTDKILFSGATPFVTGVTTGNAELTFDANVLDAPVEELSFTANDMPLFSAPGVVAAPAPAPVVAPPAPAPIVVPVPVAPPPPPPAPAPVTPSGATVTETSDSQSLSLLSGTGTVNLFGYNNTVTQAAGVNDSVKIDGEVGGASITLGNGNNDLILGGYNDDVNLGSGYNTVSGSLGNLTLVTTGAANVDAFGYGNTITLGNGDSIITGATGNETVSVGIAGSNGGTITMGGYQNDATTGGGVWTVKAGVGSDTVITGASNDTVLLSGYYNNVSVSTGHDVVSGGRGFDVYAVTGFATAGVNTPSLDVSNFSINQGDVLDLTGVMTLAGYSGSNLGNYLAVVQAGSDAEVLVTSAGVSHMVADLRGVTASSLLVGHGLTV